MWKQKLGLSFSGPMPLSPELTRGALAAGFEAFSPKWEDGERLAQWVKDAREQGLFMQSLHAPGEYAAAIWSEDKAVYEPAMKVVLRSFEDGARLGFPLMVVHVWQGFDPFPQPTEAGLEHYGQLIDRAQALGLKIAFENVEDENHLFPIMDTFHDPDVGYCWDSGHEMCYNHSMDLLKRYGHRLMITHINDNLGISRFDGLTWWTDDLHLLPYDGVADWAWNARRLAASCLPEYLNFELCVASKPGRHENDGYARMSLDEFLAQAYIRACRVSTAIERVKA